ncbi:hypothetical protein [uncultured Sphingomonas sp.]|uniref:hypothetical protein n=1 Tax=uncultured Sphingomonas sp. TaxID=158754 RepID=UPI0025DDCA9F|nr:hypothetical protein [uncultured Sphingomonas sp.]
MLNEDQDRFHRVVGWIAGIGGFVLIGLPVLAVVVIGDCFARDTGEIDACRDKQRALFLFLLVAIPLASAALGWSMCRLSRFFDATGSR